MINYKAIPKKVLHATFEKNDPLQRGLTGFIPKLTNQALGVSLAVPFAFDVAKSLKSARDRASAGYISYQPTIARMVGGTNTGAVPAMKRISNGNYGTFSDLAGKVLGGHIDDYGATPAMISALYNMGGL